jgi:Mor family transcriptional regulator
MRNETSTLVLADGESEAPDKLMDFINGISKEARTTKVFIDVTDSNVTNVAKIMLNEYGDTIEEPVNGVNDILNVIGKQMDKGDITVVVTGSKATLPAITLRANMIWAHVEISP